MPTIRSSETLQPQFFKGEIEFIIKDKHGRVIENKIQPNIIKIFSKEILSHRAIHSKIWDPEAGSGVGAWITNPVFSEDFSIKYILVGASFNDTGVPLGSDDTRFYLTDTVTGQPVPVSLDPGADYDGGLINAIPIAEPLRPLKRVEGTSFETTYQPAGTPLLQDDVRAMNNVVLLETTLELDEYNGFTGANDFFTITEVALAGGKELDAVGDCECTPRELFLEGTSEDLALGATASGGDVITLDADEDISLIKEGDQIKIVAAGGSAGSNSELDQVSPFYLVVSKAASGRDIQLDRTPVDVDNNAITGEVGVFRDTLRIFSHRVLDSPVKKTADREITIIWRIVFN